MVDVLEMLKISPLGAGFQTYWASFSVLPNVGSECGSGISNHSTLCHSNKLGYP